MGTQLKNLIEAKWGHMLTSSGSYSDEPDWKPLPIAEAIDAAKNVFLYVSITEPHHLVPAINRVTGKEWEYCPISTRIPLPKNRAVQLLGSLITFEDRGYVEISPATARDELMGSDYYIRPNCQPIDRDGDEYWHGCYQIEAMDEVPVALVQWQGKPWMGESDSRRAKVQAGDLRPEGGDFRIYLM